MCGSAQALRHVYTYTDVGPVSQSLWCTDSVMRFYFPCFNLWILFFCEALWGKVLKALDKYPWLDPIHIHFHAQRDAKPRRLDLILSCPLSNWSILQSIQLLRPNEGIVSSLQRFGNCYVIYCCNEQLLDAHTHIHRRRLFEGALWLTVMIRPPVVGPRCEIQRERGRKHRKMTEQGQGSSPSPLSPSAHHSPPPSIL